MSGVWLEIKYSYALWEGSNKRNTLIAIAKTNMNQPHDENKQVADY